MCCLSWDDDNLKIIFFLFFKKDKQKKYESENLHFLFIFRSHSPNLSHCYDTFRNEYF